MTRLRSMVCVVDDDAAVRRALGRLLRSLGLRHLEFASAVAILSDERRLEADCFLLDIQLPGMNGFELALELEGEGTRTPVIFVTAHLEETTSDRARDAGAVALLAKPFDDRELIAALRKAIGPGFAPDRQVPDPAPERRE